MNDFTTNRFRAARGRVLRSKIQRLADHLGRPIEVLDVGGRAEYWDNVGVESISRISILNNDADELTKQPSSGLFTSEFGDACCLSSYDDKSVDLVHSNSVIEHVGSWTNIAAMAGEVLRVGKSGWIQTPAWSFPIEPHFRMPFLHWFGQPVRRAMLQFSTDYRHAGIQEKRYHIDRINLLSFKEFSSLFPGCEIFVERIVMAKSYSAHWCPAELR